MVSNLKKENIYLVFWKFIWILVGLASAVIFINSLFLPGHSRGFIFPIDTLLFVIVSIVLLVGIFILDGFMNSSDKRKRIIIIIFLFLQLFMQIYLSIKLQGAQGVDDFDMRLQISSLVSGSKEWAPYFKFGPNAGAAILLSKVVSMLGGNVHASLIYNIVNFISIDIAVLAGYLIIKSITDKRIQNLYFLVVNVFSPLWITALFVYTDVGALMFGMLSIYFLTKMVETRKSSLYLLFMSISSLFASLAYFNKTNAIILSIAIFIYLIFSLKKLNWIKKVSTISFFALLMVVFSLGLSAVKNNEKAPKKSDFPYTYWVAVGYNKSTNGTVNNDTYNDTGRFKTKEQKDKHDKQLISNTIKNSSFLEILKLYWNKINIQWSMGTIGIEHREFTILRQWNTIYNYIFGQKRIFLFMWSQSLYILIVLGMLIKSIHVIFLEKFSENESILNLAALYFLGIFLFHTLLWEVQERYAYIVIIPMILIGTFGLNELANHVQEENTSKKSLNIIIALGCIATIVGWGLSYKKNYVSENNTRIVMGQNFFRKTEYNLKPHQKLVEWIQVNNTFKQWYVDGVWADNVKVTINGKKVNPVTHTLTENGKKGSYKIIVENTGNNNETIYLQKNSSIDLFQKHIEKHKNYYIGIVASDVESPFTISRSIKYTFLIVLELLIFIEGWLWNRFLVRNSMPNNLRH